MNTYFKALVGVLVVLTVSVPFFANAQPSGNTVVPGDPFFSPSGSMVPNTSLVQGGSGVSSSSNGSCASIATGGLRGLVNCIIYIFGTIAYLIMALSVLWTMYGAYLMIASEEKRDSGKQIIYHGIIGLFVMISIWGLVNILDSTFNLSKQGPFSPPPLTR